MESGASLQYPRLTPRESIILDLVWESHGYYVDRRFRYCQTLINWAIEASNYSLDRKRIQVNSLCCSQQALILQRYLKNRRRAIHSGLDEEKMLKTVEDCEAEYNARLKQSLGINIPPESKVSSEIQAPRKVIPLHLRSLTRRLEDLERDSIYGVQLLRYHASMKSGGNTFRSDDADNRVSLGDFNIHSCPNCRRNFRRKDNRDRHMRQCTRISGRIQIQTGQRKGRYNSCLIEINNRWVCLGCTRNFSTRGSVFRHLNTGSCSHPPNLG